MPTCVNNLIEPAKRSSFDLRCHPHFYQNVEALQNNDAIKVDRGARLVQSYQGQWEYKSSSTSSIKWDPQGIDKHNVYFPTSYLENRLTKVHY